MAQISLRPITAANFEDCLSLKPAEAQRHFVASNIYSLAQAYVLPEAHPRLIYADETPVGFLMYVLDPQEHTYWIYRLMIGEAFQKQGYGRAALELVLEQLRSLPGCTQVTLSYEPDNVVAAKLYASVGFAETGEVIGGETVARLRF